MEILKHKPAKQIMRIFPFAVVAIILVDSASQGFGSVEVTLVDSTNLLTMPFVVQTIDDSVNNKALWFSVIAGPHAPGNLILGGAALSAYDGTNLISSCVIKPESFVDIVGTNMALAVSGGLFSFDVGKNHLADAHFEVSYALEDQPMVMCYRFKLQTFAGAKTGVGLSLGITNDCINITRVLPNSPAAKAGLSPGLVLQRINGIPASVILGIERKRRIDPVYTGDAIGEYLLGPRDTKLQLELIDPAKGATNIFELTRL
jgi:hypothetical protein